MSEEVSYKKVLKSSSLFGAVQVVNIIIAIIRSKCLAILIGPAGYGVFALLNSIVDLIRHFSGLGLEISGVKYVSEANSTKDRDKISGISSTLLRLGVITGGIGVLLTISFSRFLSDWTFNNSGKTLAIIAVAISILFLQLSSIKISVMQGMAKLKLLAKANVFGNFAGLICTLPLYFFFNIDAIVPSIILASIISFVVVSINYRKLELKYIHNTVKETLFQSREFFLYGGLLSISGFLPLLSNYLIQVFISHASSLKEVGLFTIGMAIINSYVGVLFTAMSTEYYPRLAGLSNNPVKENEAVIQQAIIAVLAIVPVIIFFLGFSPLIIRILFSQKFNDVIPMISWAILAMFFKAVSFSMGYVIIVHGDSKVFIKTSIIFNILYISFATVGYYYAGLQGLGLGILLYYIVHLVSISQITRIRYKIILSDGFYGIFVIGLLMSASAAILNQIAAGYIKDGLFLLLLTVAVTYSYKEIDKRIFISSMVRNYFKK